MKTKMISKFAASVLAFSFCVSAQAPSAIAKQRDAAVNILFFDKNSETWNAICSGSFTALNQFREEKVIVSAGHCVDDFPKGSYGAKLSNGDTIDLELIDHEFAWPVNDFAVFRVVSKDQDAVKYIKPVKVSSKPLTVDDKVFMWSGPIGTDVNFYSGYYSGKMSFVDYPSEVDLMDWVVINSAPGSSGTVVLNAKGEAIGILVAGFGSDTKLYGALLVEIPNKN